MQVKSEDLRVFVEVLQKLNPEPADMLQLRASEAQLRSKVAKLQADADGHPLQQTINQLQQAEVSNALGPVLLVQFSCHRAFVAYGFPTGLLDPRSCVQNVSAILSKAGCLEDVLASVVA